MKSLAVYLDELAKIKGLNSDTEIATFFGVSKQYISRIRKGEALSDKICFRLAKHIKREPLELLSLNYSIRSNDREMKEYWLKIHIKIK